MDIPAEMGQHKTLSGSVQRMVALVLVDVPQLSKLIATLYV